MITKSFLIQQFTGNSAKSWFKKDTLAKTERSDGDLRYVFSKPTMNFSIYRCNSLLKWELKQQYSWNIIPQGDNSPTGFEKFNLVLNDQYCRFIFENNWKTLRLRLPGTTDDIALD